MILINSLRPSDAIWRHRSGSTLAQVMACCLTPPSHYLNQCWFIISKVQWHSDSSEGNFIRDTSASITKDSLNITYLKLNWNLPGANELNIFMPEWYPMFEVWGYTLWQYHSVSQVLAVGTSKRHSSRLQVLISSGKLLSYLWCGEFIKNMENWFQNHASNCLYILKLLTCSVSWEQINTFGRNLMDPCIIQ